MESLGRVPKIKQRNSKYKFIKIGLYLPAPILAEKIKKRVKKMFQSGLLNEIKFLRKNGISEKRLKEFGFEYNNPTIKSVTLESIRYSKRQITWFKRDKEIKWFDLSTQNFNNIYPHIKNTFFGK